MKNFPMLLLVCLLAGCQETGRTTWSAPARAAATEGITKAPPQRVIQVVHDFAVPWAEKWQITNGEKVDLNPFWRFTTQIGTDWGRMGPAESEMYWANGALCAGRPGQPTTAWSGAWFSLCGLARQDDRSRSLTAMYPPWMQPEYQCKLVSVVLDVRGEGGLKVEFKSPGGPNSVVLWAATTDLGTAGEARQVRFDVAPERTGKAKMLTVVLERGAVLAIDRVAVELESADLPFADRTFLYSYAKAAACYDPALGLSADRAHWPATDFSSTTSTALFALATAGAVDLGFVKREAAVGILDRIHRTVASVPRGPAGLLPHFVDNRDGEGWKIARGTEYSTVDTAIYYQAMLVAARMLDEQKTYFELLAAVRGLEFSKLYEDGFVIHGFASDGTTRLRSRDAQGSVLVWRDFGSETLLAIILARLAQGEAAVAKMDPPVKGFVWRGVGFVAELAALLYPQPNGETPDAITKTNWLAGRRQLLAAQMACYKHTPAGDLGLFGLSAGEGPNGVGYIANGTLEQAAPLIHPHYMLMSACLRDDPAAVYKTLQAMQERGLFTPLGGLVENVSPDLSASLPMASSLNSGFEALAAVHLLCRTSGRPDPIYEAALASPELRQAVERLYPPAK